MGGVDADRHGAMLVDGRFQSSTVPGGDIDVAFEFAHKLSVVAMAVAILKERRVTQVGMKPKKKTPRFHSSFH